MLLKKKGSYDQVDLENLVYCGLILDIHAMHMNILEIPRSSEIKNLVSDGKSQEPYEFTDIQDIKRKATNEQTRQQIRLYRQR